MTHKPFRPRPETILLLGLALSVHGPLFSQKKQASQKFVAASPSRVLTRHYQEGELLHYRMQGLNQGHQSTIRYNLRADGVVKKNQSGIFVEEFSWSDLLVNNQTVPLSPASQKFREDLSLSPQYKLSVPDLSQVQPDLDWSNYRFADVLRGCPTRHEPACAHTRGRSCLC